MATVRAERRSVSINGVPAYFRVMGHGEPLILVHGLSGSTFWWQHNAPVLAAHYTVYLVDLPGFGAMRRSHQRLLLSQAADWLMNWMQAVGISSAHLVGHSMGGLICIRVAARYPAVVRRLALIAPAGIPSGRSLVGYLFPLLVTLRYTSPRFFPILFYDALRAGMLTLLRATQDLLTQDVRDDLGNIEAPTLLIWGVYDTLVPPAVGSLLRQKIRNARLLLVKRAGHVVMYDRPRECNEALLAFFAGEEIGT